MATETLAVTAVTPRLGATVSGIDLSHPLTDEQVLLESLAQCKVCQQPVSPSAMKEARCTACRRLQRVNKDDPRLARILGEYPGLDRWNRWRLSETSRVYILLARSMWRQVLVVVDKSTLGPTRVATSGPLLPHWTEVPAEQVDRYLR